MSLYDKASLVLIPSGTKTSKVYSQVPTNGDGDFTFSRSTAATRVNASGNIEKETQNLFTYSNTFSNSAWNKNAGGSFTSGQAGYDGSNDAWQFNVTTASNSGTWQNVTFSGVATFSAYFKKGTIDKVGFTNYAGNAYECWFDLTNGTIGQQTGDLIDANIESVGGGWYRCSITDIAVSTNYFQLKPSNAYSGVSTAGYIYIQDAQLEQGLVARDYIETTTTAIYGGITDNVPRLDYTDSSCPALLLEPQRTNDVRNSEYFDASIWSYYFFNSGSLTRTFGYPSPAGTNDAYKFDVVLGTGGILLTQNITAVASADYTLSVWMKGEVGGEKVQIDFKNGASSGPSGTNFTLTTEWVRYEVSVTNDTGTGRGFQFRCTTSNVPSDQTFYVWGAQCEQGSYATSYIPTYGSAVTRNADNCEVENQSALINSEQGTLYFEGIATDPDYASVLSFSDGTLSNRICLTLPQNATNINAFSSVGGSKIDNNILHDPSINSKYAIVWNGNSFKAFVNGVKKVDNTMAGSFSANTLTDIRFDRGDGALNFEGFCKSYLSIASALTDQEAIDLTTL